MEFVDVTTVGDLFLRAADRFPDSDALVFPDRRFTYAQLSSRVWDTARSLYGMGVKPGENVGILMPNCPEFVESYFAINMLGAVVVPLNARYRRHELAHVISDGDLVALLTTDSIDEHVNFMERLYGALPGLEHEADPFTLGLPTAPKLRLIVMVGGKDYPGVISRLEFDSAREGVAESDLHRMRLGISVSGPQALAYTSGTTANPKACIISHEAIVRNWRIIGERMGIVAGDRVWDPLPFFHNGGQGPLLMTLDVGGTFITTTHFDPAEGVETLGREKVTVMWSAFPAIIMALLNDPAFDPDAFRLIRVMYNVAPTDTTRIIQDALPHVMQMSSYGLTEASGAVSWTCPSDTPEVRLKTNGTVVPGVEVRIIPDEDEDGETSDPDIRGEILFRGPYTFKGYYGDPELTAEVIDDEGWVHTGDTGFLRPDGHLCYVGRSKDMLKVGGENVAASEIEGVLSMHPGVQLVAVVPRPDEKYGEVPVAFVELRPGVASIPADELIEFCADRVAAFKVPREVRFVNEWPMSATKIQKHRLREQLEGDES